MLSVPLQMDVDHEIHRLWKVKKTLMQMCHDRGYLVTQENLDQTEKEFTDQMGNKTDGNALRRGLTVFVHHAKDEIGPLYIFFSEEPKIGSATLKGFAVHMQKDEAKRALIISKAGMTPSARQLMTEMEGLIFEHFLESELMFNITEHELVPNHKVLSEQEKQALLTRYKVKETQLPRIQSTDPVARYYGMKKGQVVKITRSSETAGRYVIYRWVV